MMCSRKYPGPLRDCLLHPTILPLILYDLLFRQYEVSHIFMTGFSFRKEWIQNNTANQVNTDKTNIYAEFYKNNTVEQQTKNNLSDDNHNIEAEYNHIKYLIKKYNIECDDYMNKHYLE